MRRKMLIGLLALGAIGGFASGICSMSCRWGHRGSYGHSSYRSPMDQHVTQVCADAIRQAQAK
jgi:hypothetical protein